VPHLMTIRGTLALPGNLVALLAFARRERVM
jgi:hypothetical protein